MELVNTETGEILEPLDRAEAERLTTRIRLRLDTIADNYVAVMPLIREAIERQAYIAMGYTGVSQYVAECFGDALTKLDVGMRREVVRELESAGMSLRAIAPVVGVSFKTVARDIEAGVSSDTPDQVPTRPTRGSSNFATSGELDVRDFIPNYVPPSQPIESFMEDDDAEPLQESDPIETAPLAPVIGIDGKRYTKPTPKRPISRDEAETYLNSIASLAAKAARETQNLTADQIRRVKPKADLWTVGLRDSIEALQRLVNSLDPQENK